MTMTNEEILREYKAAKAPSKQINILADLNQCSREQIISILMEKGVKLPGNVGPRNAPIKAEKSDPERRADAATDALFTIKSILESDINQFRMLSQIEGVLRLFWEVAE